MCDDSTGPKPGFGYVEHLVFLFRLSPLAGGHGPGLRSWLLHVGFLMVVVFWLLY